MAAGLKGSAPRPLLLGGHRERPRERRRERRRERDRELRGVGGAAGGGRGSVRGDDVRVVTPVKVSLGGAMKTNAQESKTGDCGTRNLGERSTSSGRKSRSKSTRSSGAKGGRAGRTSKDGTTCGDLRYMIINSTCRTLWYVEESFIIFSVWREICVHTEI